jgi:hypothetical protein
MDSNERVKKPEPDRTQPIRNWWTMFCPPGPPMSAASPGGPPPDGAPAQGDPISRGVEMGYRVIDEYLRQGQNVARAVWAPPPGAMPGDEGLQQRMGAMFRSFSDFASLWLDMMARMGTGHAPPVGTAGPFNVGGEARGAQAPRAEAPASEEGPTPGLLSLNVEVDSTWRTEVLLDLRPHSASLPLRVHDLRAPEPDKPRLTDVTLETVPAEERVCIRVRVPDDQPPGVYSGLILDARTNLPRGTLSVRLSPR